MRCLRWLKTPGASGPVCAPALVCLAALTLGGLPRSCARGPTPSEPRTPRQVEEPPYLKDTVGEVARVAGREVIPIQGYGFVTGLDGTGTRVIPPGVRQQILDMMRRNKVPNPEQIISSPHTAVVMVTGLLPPGITKGEVFDLEVRSVPTTETTSLEGGFVLDCDLTRVVSARGVEARSEPLAVGRGAIFVSPFASEKDGKASVDPRVGRILAGGRALKSRYFRLALVTPSVRTADQIVRVINSRFPGAAKGTTDPGRVDLETPREYQDDKMHFLDLVGALYMREAPDARDERIGLLTETLKRGEDMDRVAICLESFGATVIPRLHALADHPNESVRFFVGRTLAGLQDARAVHVLEPFAMNDKSEFQEPAVLALGKLRSGVGLGVLGRALDARNARVRIEAWRAMERLTPRTFVACHFEDKFTVSLVATKAEPFVYVSRMLRPQIALFGDVRVMPPVLAETRRVTVSATAGARVRLISSRHGHDVHVESSLHVRDLIEKMALPLEPPEKYLRGDDRGGPPGLDLGYSDVVGVLYELSRKRGLSAPLVLQPLEIRIAGDRPVARPIGPSDEEK